MQDMGGREDPVKSPEKPTEALDFTGLLARVEFAKILSCWYNILYFSPGHFPVPPEVKYRRKRIYATHARAAQVFTGARRRVCSLRKE